ncbi:hypothetical protein BDW22DRAFT_1052120 [Trametopsis cervina]|nr:hypothetical protein BDW22DRAFT_1052120 [Trametopsis cervina]
MEWDGMGRGGKRREEAGSAGHSTSRVDRRPSVISPFPPPSHPSLVPCTRRSLARCRPGGRARHLARPCPYVADPIPSSKFVLARMPARYTFPNVCRHVHVLTCDVPSYLPSRYSYAYSSCTVTVTARVHMQEQRSAIHILHTVHAYTHCSQSRVHTTITISRPHIHNYNWLPLASSALSSIKTSGQSARLRYHRSYAKWHGR